MYVWGDNNAGQLGVATENECTKVPIRGPVDIGRCTFLSPKFVIFQKLLRKIFGIEPYLLPSLNAVVSFHEDTGQSKENTLTLHIMRKARI